VVLQHFSGVAAMAWGARFFLLVSYQPLASFIDDQKTGLVTPYDSGIDTSDTPQHRNRSATRDASRRAAA